MARHITAYPPIALSPVRKWLISAGTLLLFSVVAFFDYVTGKEFSFTLLYLAPIALSIWFVGPELSLVQCFLASACSVAFDLKDGAAPAAAFWNAGIRFGVYLLFFALIRYLREHRPSVIRATCTRRWIAAAALAPCLALVAASILHITPAAGVLRTLAASSRNGTSTEKNPLAELASLVEESMKESRPLLLGSRDPSGTSCVTISRTGDAKGNIMPTNLGDLDGGPGTSMAVLYYFDRQQIKSPLADFKWHQTRLRRYLENNISRGIGAEELAQQTAARAREFLDAADAWPELPADLTSIDFAACRDNWPSCCIASLDRAIRDKNLAEVRHWARELAAATFWLEDLHRWRNFLHRDFLAALDFQARCESLFAAAELQHAKYEPDGSISQLPAGVLGLNGTGNFHEVERQAEQLYSMPFERLAELDHHRHLTSGSVWIAPESREAFLELRSVLSPDNQRTWDLAAQTPYEHGYLANILFRARTVGLVYDLQAVLKTFNARNPHATVNDLMGVMMYRGHSFAGIEWGDRFQPQLTEAAAKIDPGQTDLEALRAAWEWTNKFYKAENYGPTLTLREALDQRKLDCVRATDMMAAIFRNAGRTRMGHVRWCSETGGHSVAAYLGPDEPRSKPHLADGLTAPHQPEVWPDCYFQGHAWPPSMPANQPPYAMELYMRGIDSYVWTQGYIVRGPNAGLLMTAANPNSKQFGSESTRKIYDGPYPK
jgi:hypothetical protein